VRALVDHGKSLIQTMLEAHDRRYLETADYARTIPIPTLGIGAVDFGLPPARIDALFDSGAKAAEQFLSTWDFQGYVEGFRRGDPPSRKQEIAARMRAATPPSSAPHARPD
jgi:NTE family protein